MRRKKGGGGKKGSSFSELAPTNSLLISAILSIHSFERNFLPGRCTDFPLFSREREPGLRIEHRVPRNAYIVDNYRNHRQVDGIATRKENERRKTSGEHFRRRFRSLHLSRLNPSTRNNPPPTVIIIIEFDRDHHQFISNLCSPFDFTFIVKRKRILRICLQIEKHIFLIKKKGKKKKRRREWQTEHYLYRA